MFPHDTVSLPLESRTDLYDNDKSRPREYAKKERVKTCGDALLSIGRQTIIWDDKPTEKMPGRVRTVYRVTRIA